MIHVCIFIHLQPHPQMLITYYLEVRLKMMMIIIGERQLI